MVMVELGLYEPENVPFCQTQITRNTPTLRIWNLDNLNPKIPKISEKSRRYVYLNPKTEEFWPQFTIKPGNFSSIYQFSISVSFALNTWKISGGTICEKMQYRNIQSTEGFQKT